MYYKYCIMGKFIKVVKVIKKYRFWLRTKRSGVRIPPSANKRTLFGEFFYWDSEPICFFVTNGFFPPLAFYL